MEFPRGRTNKIEFPLKICEALLPKASFLSAVTVVNRTVLIGATAMDI